MKVYRLRIAPSESDGEGEDHDKWFASLEYAKIARRKLAAMLDADEWAGHRYGEDFEIIEYELAKLAPKVLLLAVFNRGGYAVRSRVVVPAYKRPK